MEFIILFIYLVLLPHSLFNLAVLAQNSSHHPLCQEAESFALLSFKDSFLISKSASANPSAYPKVKSWNTNSENGDCCSWDGVQCDQETGHVIGLNLSSSCLYGFINSGSQLLFHNLSQLRHLNLADNDFNFSQIPSGIGQLKRLIYLNLSASAFSGQIPSEILYLSNLSSLDLSLNTDPFSGKKLLKLKRPGLRSLAQNLSSLAHLDLSYVDIDSVVPQNLANLSSLTFLDLTDSGLHGEFPVHIFNLPNLEFINVRFNRELSGRLPEFHSKMPLKSLRLGGTIFSGELPSSIGKLHSLTELRVRGSNFSGYVPSSIGNLTKLTYLDLANNTFGGHIPSSLQNLTQLRFLQLSYNGFSGRTLPWIGKLRNLTLLDLVRTNLQGEIPPSYANLTKLSTFSLAYNQLTGSVPIWIANLTRLTDLYLSRNNLTGSVDLDPFINHETLSVLRLSFNNLSLFSNNATLREMRFLDLASCNLKKFPEFLKYSNNKLEWLDLSYNNIRGTMSPKIEISKWSKIEAIYLRFNMLQGSLPIPPPTTTVYMASNNEFSGEISPSICDLHSLFALDLSFNNLSGQLPPCLANFSDSLTILKLQNNNFQGSIPNSCNTEGSRLVSLIDLSSNRLEGPIPRSLSNCKMLEYFHVGDNLIRDVFPFWLGTIPNLNVLILRANKFYGSISAVDGEGDNWYFSELRIIDLSYNNFSGSLPSKYFQHWNAMKIEDMSKLKYMQANKTFDVERYTVNRNFDFSITLTNKGVQTTYTKIQELFTAIDLSSNRFEGQIPELIGDLKGLRSLNLSNNNLMGQIPISLGELSKLEALDLSKNKLSGEIPQQLTKLNFLSFFDVSDNNLSGTVPRGGQFDTFPESSFDGNIGLSVNGNSEDGNHQDPPSPPSASDNGEGSDDDDESVFEMVEWEMVVVGYGIGLLVGVVIGHFVTTKKFDWVLHSLGMRRLQIVIETGRRN